MLQHWLGSKCAKPQAQLAGDRPDDSACCDLHAQGLAPSTPCVITSDTTPNFKAFRSAGRAAGIRAALVVCAQGLFLLWFPNVF